jgi:hypothetical protein
MTYRRARELDDPPPVRGTPYSKHTRSLPNRGYSEPGTMPSIVGGPRARTSNAKADLRIVRGPQGRPASDREL